MLHQNGVDFWFQKYYLTPLVKRQPGFHQGTRRASLLQNLVYLFILKEFVYIRHHFIVFSSYHINLYAPGYQRMSLGP